MLHERFKNLKRYKRYFITAGIAVVFAILSAVAYFVPFKRFLTAFSFSPIEEGEVRLHFLSIGQGDCTICEFPDGEIFIIDAGEGGFDEENKLIRYVKGLKAEKINLILTHANVDHYGGFQQLLKVFEVDKFYLPVLSSEDKKYTRLLQAIEHEGCVTDTLTRYSSIDCAGGSFVCLSPHVQGETDENDSSTVLYLNLGAGIDALFCGDITSVRERTLLMEYQADASIFDVENRKVDLSGIDFVKVAHHGSGDSSCSEFLELVRPRNSFISCGRNNSYGFPSAETIKRLKNANGEGNIYRLDELGDMIVSVKDGEYTVMAREEK